LLLIPILAFSVDAVFDPDPSTAQMGEELSVTIAIQESVDFRGYRLVINFDETHINFTDAEFGSLFQGQNVGWWLVDDDTPGQIAIECVIFGAGLFVSGPGSILTLTFDPNYEGASGLEIAEFLCFDPLGIAIPDCTGSDGTVIIGSSTVYVDLECWLEGPFQDPEMSTALQTNIPLTSPYTSAPAAITEIPTDMVDWILVELRSEPSGATLSSRSCLLLNDGQVNSTDSPLILFDDVAAGDFYVVVKHRNHVAIMSSYTVPFVSSGSSHTCDLGSSSNIYGSGGCIALSDRISGMIAGDADQDGGVYPADRNEHWRIQTGSSGYLSADFSLDGNVFPDDRNGYWVKNSGLSSQVPEQR